MIHLHVKHASHDPVGQEAYDQSSNRPPEHA